MRKVQVLVAVWLLVFGALGAAGQAGKQGVGNGPGPAVVERELREFFEAYAEDLRLGRGERIAERYDSRGYYRMGNGAKTLVSFEDNRKRFVTNFVGPKAFAWKDLSVEILAPDAAVVTALFDWQIGSSPSRLYSYTGVLTKRSGKWRIRLEDESGAPPARTAPAN
jgi:hypothetical protein